MRIVMKEFTSEPLVSIEKVDGKLILTIKESSKLKEVIDLIELKSEKSKKFDPSDVRMSAGNHRKNTPSNIRLSEETTHYATNPNNSDGVSFSIKGSAIVFSSSALAAVLAAVLSAYSNTSDINYSYQKTCPDGSTETIVFQNIDNEQLERALETSKIIFSLKQPVCK